MMSALYVVACLALVAGSVSAMPGASDSAPNSPTHIDSSSSPIPTVAPISKAKAGYISCVQPNGHAYKVAAQHSKEFMYRHTDGDDLLQVKIDLEAAKTKPVYIELITAFSVWNFWDVLVLSPPKIPYTCFGAVTDRNNINSTPMSNSSSFHAWLAPTQRQRFWRARATKARWGAAPYGWGAIWLYDPESRRLIPQWPNALNMTSDLHAFYDVKHNRFGITGNVLALAESGTLEGPSHQCNLTFTPL